MSPIVLPFCYSEQPVISVSDSKTLPYPCQRRSNYQSSDSSSSSSFSSSTSSLSDAYSDDNFYDIAYSSSPKMMEMETAPRTNNCTTNKKNPTHLKRTKQTVPIASLSGLPFEIRSLIAQECLQADAFRLCLTCKDLYSSTVSRLYQCIVFDSAHRHFNKEFTYKRLKPSTVDEDADDISRVDHESRYFSYTSVRTVGGLRRCMKTLRADKVKAGYVRRFECLNSMDLPDLEIRQFVKDVFPSMPNLASLVWDASPEITVDLVQQIARPEYIETLCLDLALRNDKVSRSIAQMVFPNLRHLTIRPYLSSEFLVLIAKMISNSPDTIKNLRALYLGRELHLSHEVGSGFAFASMNPSQSPVDDQAIPAFFGTLLAKNSENTKLRLTHLGLDGITVNGGIDFQILDQAVELETITHLKLAGTDMIGFETEDEVRVNGAGISSVRFVQPLGPKLQKLQSLEVDWSEQFVNNVPNFFQDLTRGLQSLSVIIRSNIARSRSDMTWSEHCQHYVDSITTSHCRTLKQLALDGVEEISFKDVYKPLPMKALLTLRDCVNLTGLSVSAPSPSLDSNNVIDKLLHCMPHLRFFHLRNNHTKPYLGQNVSYQIEDWIRYKHSVERFINAQLPSKSLSYIKLENHVFDVSVRNKPAVIREGLLRWFDENVFTPWEV